MRHLPLLSLCLALIFSPLVRAQDLTAEELKVAQHHLEKTRDAFLAATQGLSEAQWTFQPAPNRWSVQQVSEHIASTEDFIMGTIKDRVMSAPPRSEPADLKEIDTFVSLVRTYGIKELVRTGAVVMARGSGSIEEAIKR